MRVVITGATGNVGTALVQSLVSEPAVEEIVGVARRVPDLVTPKTRWVSRDVGVESLDDVMDGADALVHLAWAIQPAREPAVLERTNVRGTARVLEAAVRAGVGAVVHASSVGAYSPGPKDTPVDEAWPTGGVATSFYSRQKADAERMLDLLEAAETAPRVVRMRPGLVFCRGAASGIHRLFLGRHVSRRLIDPRGPLVVPDLAGLAFQVVGSDDLADAYRRALLRDVRGAFNIAADPWITPEAIVSIRSGARTVRVPSGAARAVLALAFGVGLSPTPPGWLDMALSVPMMDTSRAHRELGWAPARSGLDALRDLLGGLSAGAGSATPPLAPRVPSQVPLARPPGRPADSVVAGDVEGRWAVERVSGLLPPLDLVRKSVSRSCGVTTLGPVRVPFDVVTADGAVSLRYRPPLGFIVDRIEPGGGGGLLGSMTVSGRRLARFRLRRLP